MEVKQPYSKQRGGFRESEKVQNAMEYMLAFGQNLKRDKVKEKVHEEAPRWCLTEAHKGLPHFLKFFFSLPQIWVLHIFLVLFLATDLLCSRGWPCLYLLSAGFIGVCHNASHLLRHIFWGVCAFGFPWGWSTLSLYPEFHWGKTTWYVNVLMFMDSAGTCESLITWWMSSDCQGRATCGPNIFYIPLSCRSTCQLW